MIVLFEHSEKRLGDRLKFEAQIHGLEMKEEPQPQRTFDGSEPRTDRKCIPGDPDSYNHLSMEEREELTRQMMGKHKLWAQESKPLGGKAARKG